MIRALCILYISFSLAGNYDFCFQDFPEGQINPIENFQGKFCSRQAHPQKTSEDKISSKQEITWEVAITDWCLPDEVKPKAARPTSHQILRIYRQDEKNTEDLRSLSAAGMWETSISVQVQAARRHNFSTNKH